MEEKKLIKDNCILTIILVIIICWDIFLTCIICETWNKNWGNNNVGDGCPGCFVEDEEPQYEESQEIFQTKYKTSLYGDTDDKIRYGSKEVYYEKKQLIIADTTTDTKKIIEDDSSAYKVTILNNKIYYFKLVQNGNEYSNELYSYNLDTNEKENLNLTSDICEGIYSVVAYNNKLYFGVFNSKINTDTHNYGIVTYDIEKKVYSLFSNLDIRCLDENFLFVGDGFLSVKNSELIHIDLNGNHRVKFKFEANDLLELNDEIEKIDNSTIKLTVLELTNYWEECGYIKIDLNTYKVIEKKY